MMPLSSRWWFESLAEWFGRYAEWYSLKYKGKGRNKDDAISILSKIGKQNTVKVILTFPKDT